MTALKVAPVVLTVLLGAACAEPVAAPAEDAARPPSFIVGGQPDFAHTNVGAVVTLHPFVPGNPLAPLCSGTLIDQDVVVTAGHCAFFIVAFQLPAWVTFDQQFSGTSPLIPATAVPHPNFVPSRNPNDVGGIGGDPFELGVLRLDEPVTDRAPAPLPPAGLLDDLKKGKSLHPGDPFTVVGYGAIGFADGFPTFDGQRRSAEVPYRSLNGEAVTLDTKRNDYSICFGDSGGPNFLEVDGQDVLTSVTWWSGAGPLSPNVIDLNCAGVWHRAYRLDIPQARDFLDDFVALP